MVAFGRWLWYYGDMDGGEKVLLASNKRLIIILSLLCAAVVGLIVSVTIVIIHGKTQGDYVEVESDEESGESESSTRMPVEEYIALINDKIENAETIEEKAKLYLDRAIELNLYSIDDSSDNYDKTDYSEMILNDVYKSEGLNPTEETAWWVGYFEELYGSEERAEEYKAKARERGYDSTSGAG